MRDARPTAGTLRPGLAAKKFLKPGELPRCRRCRRYQPDEEFPRSKGGRHPYCKTCNRVRLQEYRRTEAGKAEAGKAKAREYKSRPEVKAREAARRRAKSMTEEDRDSRRRYMATPLGKLLACRSKARGELKTTGRPERAGRLRALIALYDAEIARLRRGPDGAAGEADSCLKGGS